MQTRQKVEETWTPGSRTEEEARDRGGEHLWLIWVLQVEYEGEIQKELFINIQQYVNPKATEG